MISCGEPSGDLYAGALAAELRQRVPDIELFGFGGPRLEAAGARLVGRFTGLSVTGLTEALRVLPRSYAMLRRLVRAARECPPDAFVAIDFPDFNLRLIAALHRLGIPIVYYVSPQLWAWRPGRMRTMKRLASRVLVIFPFEEPLYAREEVPVRFVGHPLVDLALARQDRSGFLRDHGLNPDAPTVALLPGSRPNELRRIVPVLMQALPLIRERVRSAQFVVACASDLPDTLFHSFRGAADPPVLVRGRTDDVLAAADVAIIASGTATVQAALHQRPMVVVYRLSPLTYYLGRPLVKVDMFAMANLVAGRRIVPELIQNDFTPERVADETVSFLTDRRRYTQTRDALLEVRERLGRSGASGRAADAVLDVARRRRRHVTS